MRNMRAYCFRDYASLDSLQLGEEASAVPQRGEVLVGVRAVALNYRDIAMLRNRYPHRSKIGLIPCSDAAGEILAVGPDVTAFAARDRVISTFHPRWFGGEMPSTAATDGYGSERDGWLTESKLVSQEAVVRMPRGLSFEEAATLPCAGLTAWTALSGARPVRAGHTVLTLGSGGVSIFALQLAKACGARVIATTSSAEKAERLRALRADEVVNYRCCREWGEEVRALTAGRGVDRVVEVGGPATLKQSLRAVARGGEVVLIGFLSSDDPGIGYFELKQTVASIRSITVGDRAGLQEVVRVIESTGIRPIIDQVFPFENARAAFERLESGTHIGKVVIRCDATQPGHAP
jgi:NADPH:quinone reductase-like Zn-dependent oxidoreductase